MGVLGEEKKRRDSKESEVFSVSSLNEVRFKVIQSKIHDNPKMYFYSIIDNLNQESLDYLAVDEVHLQYGVVEIGPIVFSKKIQRTAKRTEAISSTMKHFFNKLGFKRVEWRRSMQMKDPAT